MYFSKLLRKTAFFGLLAILLLSISTTIVIKTSGDKNFVPAPDSMLVNDITGLNPVRVASIITPTSSNEIINAIRNSSSQISIGGGRYSQGGQIAAPNSLHIDMRKFNKILEINVRNKQATVQAGVTWRQLQEELDKHNLSVKIMQTYANFTVGGSLSVNVHGRYIGAGPLIRSVNSIRIVTADGNIINASPEQNADIFYGAIGGYGGLGVIVEATLQLAENTKIERVVSKMPVGEYAVFFANNIRDNDKIVMHNGDIYPPDYETVSNVSWQTTNKEVTSSERLIPAEKDYALMPILAKISADYDWGKWARQAIVEPYYYSSPRIVWRNWEASYNISELQEGITTDTAYGLREYFVPVNRFDEFVPKMRDIFQRSNANIINVSIRHALPDSGSLLAWAPGEVFAFVVFYQQETNPASREQVGKWTREMVDAAISVGGSYYLPYQIYASEEQFHAAYPRANEYIALKKRIDPNNRFTNKLWEAYYPENHDTLANKRKQIADYFKPEEQSYLSIPEWYLVFNPVEYSAYLDVGKNPSNFPFMASIDEYWILYDRVIAMAGMNYAHNNEYMLMLNVIGISTTIEYMLKSAYENTIGRFTHWTAASETPEEKIMRNAYRAYSELIFDKAWYEFGFWPWVESVWSTTPFFGPDFIRKTERKLFFTLEFGFKAMYAEAIGYASKNTFDPSTGKIHMTINSNANSKPLPTGVDVMESSGLHKLVSLPRWQGFTETLPALAAAGYTVEDISGNPMIAASIIVPSNKVHKLPTGSYWFTSRIVSDPNYTRIVMPVAVRTLHTFLAELPASNARLEHLYDF